MLTDPSDIVIRDQQVSAPEIKGDTEANVRAVLNVPNGPEALIVKRGSAGATVHLRDGSVTEVPGFPVDIYNVLGAGGRLCQRFYLRTLERVGLLQVRPDGERLRCHRSDPARLCELYGL